MGARRAQTLNFPEYPKLLWPGLCFPCSCGNDGANNSSVSTGKSPISPRSLPGEGSVEKCSTRTFELDFVAVFDYLLEKPVFLHRLHEY